MFQNSKFKERRMEVQPPFNISKTYKNFSKWGVAFVVDHVTLNHDFSMQTLNLLSTRKILVHVSWNEWTSTQGNHTFGASYECEVWEGEEHQKQEEGATQFATHYSLFKEGTGRCMTYAWTMSHWAYLIPNTVASNPSHPSYKIYKS